MWLDEAEIALLAEHGVGVAHNPVTNMKLASGAARVEEMLAHGITVGLGTDGEKENNNLDMFEEMKTSSLLGKLSKWMPPLSTPGLFAAWPPPGAPPWDWTERIDSRRQEGGLRSRCARTPRG